MNVAGARLKRIAVELLHLSGKRKCFVQVFLLSDKEMRVICKKVGALPAIKKTKMGRELSQETHLNVLSFPEKTKFPALRGQMSLGEVYINYDWAEKKIEILVYLLVHGILHLLGYNHKRKRDTIRMEKLEKKLWHHVLSSG